MLQKVAYVIKVVFAAKI